MTEHKPVDRDRVATRKVLIVEDHPITRAGIRSGLEGEVDFEVVGCAESVAEALAMLGEHGPELMTLDLNLGKESSLPYLDDLREASAGVRILVVSMFDELESGFRAISAGADGYIQKDAPMEELVLALRTVAGGGKYMSPKLAAMFVDVVKGKARQGGMLGLSKREFEAFQLMGIGLPTRDIAQKMGISPRTVEAHKEHIKSKLGVPTVAEVAKRAAQFMQGSESPGMS